MKKWNIRYADQQIGNNNQYTDLINLLLDNRGIKGKEEQEEFLHPLLNKVSIESVGIDKTQLKKTRERLQRAYDNKEQIIVFGDYDVDGITGSAILWECLYSLGFKVIPYIPHRVDEGYGLSIKGIENLQIQTENIKLIITVDNGIVAHEAVDFANKLGIDVIITDHHLPEGETIHPNAYAIVHTTKLCGAGVAYLLSQEIQQLQFNSKNENGTFRLHTDSHLELAALGTIADLVPLTGANRTIVKYGLEKLRTTRRLGLLALFTEAAIDMPTIGTYEVGFVIAPRLNASGRIESAMDSLRLLCTQNEGKAFGLAGKLGVTNRSRQDVMKKAVDHALEALKHEDMEQKRIIMIGHETYNPGVIGLVAGKLVEKFYRPAIVLSIGETTSKASVRSISGVNIIELLRTHQDMFVNVGGHPMAAGFTVATEKIHALQQKLEALAKSVISDDLLQRSVSIDCELSLDLITPEFYHALQQLAPFGMGNPEPVFVTRGVLVQDIRILGREGKHIKLKVLQEGQEARMFDVIGFNMAQECEALQIGDKIDIVYSVDENRWNGNVSLQLKLKDISS